MLNGRGIRTIVDRIFPDVEDEIRLRVTNIDGNHVITTSWEGSGDVYTRFRTTISNIEGETRSLWNFTWGDAMKCHNEFRQGKRTLKKEEVAT